MAGRIASLSSTGAAGRRAGPAAIVVASLLVATVMPATAQAQDASRALAGSASVSTTTTSSLPTSTTTASTSPTTAPTSTSASVASTSTSTTAPGPETSSGDPSTSLPVDGSEPAPDDGAGSDAEGDEVDPLSGEGPGEEAPGADPDIPPPETYGGQEPYQAPEILWSSVAEAERKLERSRQAKRDAVAAVRALRRRGKHLDRERQALDDQTKATIAELDAALERYQGRAVTDYRLFAAGVGPQPPDRILPSGLDDVIQQRRGARLATAALGVGNRDLARLGDLRQSLDGDAATLLDRLRLVADYQTEAEVAVTVADEEIEQASIEYEAFKAGSEVFITGVAFPLGGPHNLPLIDSFGFPRMTGTEDEHWHEGIDLFAPRGTPLVATERGIVTRIGFGRLGGLKLWLVGESGTEWYYAHLDSFAAGLGDGQVVEAGDLLGYVGNTGNAVGTPPHLHMQMHPGGGRPVNPYPLLKTVSDLDQQAMAAGTHRGWANEPVVMVQSVAVTGPTG